ncbi:hypothetical protein ABBQ38_014942 [Trebouxia sp. C0009 RCD-2024]
MPKTVFERLGQIMAMVKHHDESDAAFLARVKQCMEQLYTEFAAQTSCVEYLQRQWASDIKLNTQPELPEHDSWTQLTKNLELEDEAEQHEQGITTTTGRQTQAASDSALATQRRRTADSEMLAQFQRLLEASRGNADMRNILLAKLNQAEGSFDQLANRNLAGLSLPAQTIGKVQDGLPDSTVRLRSALEGRTKARRKPKPSTAVVMASLPPVVPLPAAQPSRKKRSFAELLTSGRHADKLRCRCQY